MVCGARTGQRGVARDRACLGTRDCAYHWRRAPTGSQAFAGSLRDLQEHQTYTTTRQTRTKALVTLTTTNLTHCNASAPNTNREHRARPASPAPSVVEGRIWAVIGNSHPTTPASQTNAPWASTRSGQHHTCARKSRQLHKSRQTFDPRRTVLATSHA